MGHPRDPGPGDENPGDFRKNPDPGDFWKNPENPEDPGDRDWKFRRDPKNPRDRDPEHLCKNPRDFYIPGIGIFFRGMGNPDKKPPLLNTVRTAVPTASYCVFRASKPCNNWKKGNNWWRVGTTERNGGVSSTCFNFDYRIETIERNLGFKGFFLDKSIHIWDPDSKSSILNPSYESWGRKISLQLDFSHTFWKYLIINTSAKCHVC